MTRYRVWAAGALLAGVLLGYFVWSTERDPTSPYHFKLGLDLAGGTELIYKADMSETPSGERTDALAALQGVIDRRVNLFGVAEPLVQTERASALSGTTEDRLIVDLPGVTDIDAAVAALGKTPTLEFKLATTTSVGTTTSTAFAATGLTGRYLSSATLQFGSGATAGLAAPQILINFNSEGAALFERLTTEHTGETLAIFLDGQPISTPVIQEPIPGGTAVISGQFTAVEARDLVRNLNFGALPVPITLQSSSAVGPTLGAAAIAAGITAAFAGFAIIALFMIGWYRLPGVIAVIALAEYLLLMLALIKFIPVTLTASGIAGLIITLGMAVDANVLIFERTKEELRKGSNPREAVAIGFARAWTAIRDGHLTMIISGAILFWLGTSIVQGFALVFVLGVLASFISAVSVSRVYLMAIVPEAGTRTWRFLLSSGLRPPASGLRPPAPSVMFIVLHRRFFFWVTGALLAAAIAAIGFWGLPLGIDFTGGSLTQVAYPSGRPSLATVEQLVAGEDLGAVSVRASGENAVTIRSRSLTPEEHTSLLSALSVQASTTELAFTSVGPVLGSQFAHKALWALLAVVLAIVLYIAWAFRGVSRPVPSWGYGITVVAMLAIDIIVPAGFFAALCHFTGAEVDSLFVVALLALLGYVVNDIIVVFDRVREHLKNNEKLGTKEPFEITVGKSISETMARSINTALTVVLALTALILLGAPATRNFALVMLVGVVAGTFSSICRSAPLLIPLAKWFNKVK